MFALDEVQSTQNTLVYHTTSRAKLQFASHIRLCFAVKNNSEDVFSNISLCRDMKSPCIGFIPCISVMFLDVSTLSCVTVGEDESICLGLFHDMTETQCMSQHPNFASQPLSSCYPVVLLY